MLIQESSDRAYAAAHLLSVDSYVLQHSETHGPRSNALHLLRLGWLLFGGGDPDVAQKNQGPMPFFMREYRNFPYLQPPPAGRRGEFTVVDVLKAQSADEHRELAYRWGHSVWGAYEDHHEWAKRLLGNAGVRIA